MRKSDGRDMDKGSTYTGDIVIPVTNFGKPPTNPPAVIIFGITVALEFTVDTDKAYVVQHIPNDYVSGTDIDLNLIWTRSSTGSDDSTKMVKWQIKWITASVGANLNSGETTETIEDTYDSSDTSSQIMYRTGNIVIPASSISSGDCLIFEIKAITPSGTALSDPALVAMCLTYTAQNRVV